MASATSSELWNQPRCWSLPSRYMSAGQVEAVVARQHRLVARSRVEPHVEDVLLALERGAAARRARQAVGQELLDRPLVPGVGAVHVEERRARARRAPASAPPRRTTCSPPPESARPRRAGARCTSRGGSSPCCGCGRGPRPGSTSPGGRWRAARPPAACGVRRPRTRSTGSPSMRTNHCDVARKITGLWQRQQCGYWCWNVLAVPQPRRARAAPARPSGWRRTPAGRRRAPPCRGSARPARSARRSRGRTSRRSGSRRRRGPGAVCTAPVPCSSVT